MPEPAARPTIEPSLLSPLEVAGLEEIRRLLDLAYEHYFATSDGYCKPSEGHIGIGFTNYFDSRAGTKGIQDVTLYSYVFGTGRSHEFGSVEAALEAVRDWYSDELATVRDEVGDTIDPPHGAPSADQIRAAAVSEFEQRLAAAVTR